MCSLCSLCPCGLNQQWSTEAGRPTLPASEHAQYLVPAKDLNDGFSCCHPTIDCLTVKSVTTPMSTNPTMGPLVMKNMGYSHGKALATFEFFLHPVYSARIPHLKCSIHIWHSSPAYHTHYLFLYPLETEVHECASDSESITSSLCKDPRFTKE